MLLKPQNGLRTLEAYEDFILSKKASLCSPKTISYYDETVGKFVDWLKPEFIHNITPRHVREFLLTVKNRNVSDYTIHKNARGIRAFLRFCHREGYCQEIRFEMPRVEEKIPHILNLEEIKKIICSCRKTRDRALVLFMIDTGVRRSEICRLNWGDIDLSTGLVHVRNTKSKKDRFVVAGSKSRRALLKYRREVDSRPPLPLFQTMSGDRMKPNGLRSLLRRLGERAGVNFGCHDLRRVFATWSLKSGMDSLYIQRLMGHSSLDVTLCYLRFLSDDLIDNHRQFGPVDRFLG